MARSIFLYAVAAHEANILSRQEINSTIRKAVDIGYETAIVIKKTQLIAKERELKKKLGLEKVKAFPKASVEKAIKESDACLIVLSCVKTTRKKPFHEKLMAIANKYEKLVIVINLENSPLTLSGNKNK